MEEKLVLSYCRLSTRVGLLKNLSLDRQSQTHTAAWACFIQNTGLGTALSGSSQQFIFPPFQDPSANTVVFVDLKNVDASHSPEHEWRH